MPKSSASPSPHLLRLVLHRPPPQAHPQARRRARLPLRAYSSPSAPPAYPRTPVGIRSIPGSRRPLVRGVGAFYDVRARLAFLFLLRRGCSKPTNHLTESTESPITEQKHCSGAFAEGKYSLQKLLNENMESFFTVNAILSVLLSSFTGFGIAISTNSLLVEYLRWRARSHRSSYQHSDGAHPQQAPSRQNPIVEPGGNNVQQETNS